MELTEKKNFWLFMYRFFSGDKNALPQSVCPLFWKGLLCFIGSPVFLIYFGIRRLFKDQSILRFMWSNNYTAIGIFFVEKIIIFIYLVTVALGSSVFIGEGTTIANTPLWIWLIGWVIMPLILCVALFLIFGLGFLLFSRESPIKETLSVPLEYTKSKVNKICPKITWK